MPSIQPVVDLLVNPGLLAPNCGSRRIQPMVTSLGEVLSEALDRLGQSQMWLAEQVGVSPQAVTKWMQTGQISREKVTDVARVLGVSIDTLLGALPAEGSQIGHVIGQLPDNDQQQILDFVRYKFERAETVITGERAAHYIKMIDRIKEDMDARRTSPPQPDKRPPPRKRKRK